MKQAQQTFDSEISDASDDDSSIDAPTAHASDSRGKGAAGICRDVVDRLRTIVWPVRENIGAFRTSGNYLGTIPSKSAVGRDESPDPSIYAAAAASQPLDISAKASQLIRVAFLLRKLDCEDGIASHCETLIRQLNKLNVEVVVIVGRVSVAPNTQARLEALKSLASEWINLSLPDRRLNPEIPAARFLAAQLRDFDISVVHLHGMGTLLLARLACWRRGVPIVATVHLSPVIISHGPRAALTAVARPLLWMIWPTRLIAISSDIRNTFKRRLGLPEQRIDTVFNGVDASYFRLPTREERTAARQSLGLGEGDLVISHVGRLAHVKGHDVLLNATALLVGQHPNLKVICRGIGPDLQALEAMCSELKIAPHVKFLGQGDTRVVYWASDLFVLPSRREGFALVVVEAMLCGAVPIRTRTSGAVDQTEDGENGFICPFDDPAALAKLIDLLICDKTRLLAVRENAVRSARERFDAALMGSKTFETYRKAMHQHNRSPLKSMFRRGLK
jgi:glycosyltransferase involved in cell wall biosynthesis